MAHELALPLPPKKAAKREALSTSLPTKAHGVTLHLAPGSSSGYKGVWMSGKKNKPYMAVVGFGKATKSLGKYSTAVEAAVAYAKCMRDPKEAAAWKEECASKRLADRQTEAKVQREELVRQHTEKGQVVEAEGLTLILSSTNKTGYQGVQLDERKKNNRYRVEVEVKGVKVSLGRFETAVEGAVVYARHNLERLKKEGRSSPLEENTRPDASAERE